MKKTRNKALNLYACSIHAFHKELDVDLPIDLLRVMANTPLIDRWAPGLNIDDEFEDGADYLNIKFFNNNDIEDELGIVLFGGLLLYVNKDKKRLTDPHGKITEQAIEDSDIYAFMIAPQHKLAVIAEKEVSPRLSRYLQQQITAFHKATNNANKIDNIIVRPIPNEGEPTKWLRKNSNLASVKARMNVDTFKKYFGVQNVINNTPFDFTDGEPEEIIVKLEFSAGRGQGLPEVFAENVIDFIDATSKEKELYSAYYKDLKGSRKSSFKRLLNMLLNKNISVEYATIDDYQEKIHKELANYISELIEMNDESE